MAERPVVSVLIAELTERVNEQMDSWRPGAIVREVRPLTGGTSSLTFLVDLIGVVDEETPIVLKVAPPGLEPLRNRDVLRQARLQAVLQGGERRLAPDVLFTDPGAPPHSPPFMAMNFVRGECVEPILRTVDVRPEPAVVVARYIDATDVLASLHSASPEALGLADEPALDLGAEIDRWTRAFATLPNEMRGDYEKAAECLRATIPASLSPVVTHGDYRLGNTLCEGNRLEAIIDWEIWSVGDPRIDLSWLTFFTDDSHHPAAEPGPPAGTPSRVEVVRRYEQQRGVTIVDLDWFDALTRYKEAA